MSGRPGVSSARTRTEPINFTRSEFVRGAIAAWAWFLVLHQIALIPLGGYGLLALYVTLPWSIGALLLASPVAYVLALGLRTQPRVGWHLVAFAALGLVVGTIATAMALLLPAWGIPSDGSVPTWCGVVVALSAGPAVALGWWHSARRSLARG